MFDRVVGFTFGITEVRTYLLHGTRLLGLIRGLHWVREGAIPWEVPLRVDQKIERVLGGVGHLRSHA